MSICTMFFHLLLALVCVVFQKTAASELVLDDDDASITFGVSQDVRVSRSDVDGSLQFDGNLFEYNGIVNVDSNKLRFKDIDGGVNVYEIIANLSSTVESLREATTEAVKAASMYMELNADLSKRVDELTEQLETNPAFGFEFSEYLVEHFRPTFSDVADPIVCELSKYETDCFYQFSVSDRYNDAPLVVEILNATSRYNMSIVQGYDDDGFLHITDNDTLSGIAPMEWFHPQTGRFGKYVLHVDVYDPSGLYSLNVQTVVIEIKNVSFPMPVAEIAFDNGQIFNSVFCNGDCYDLYPVVGNTVLMDKYDAWDGISYTVAFDGIYNITIPNTISTSQGSNNNGYNECALAKNGVEIADGNPAPVTNSAYCGTNNGCFASNGPLTVQVTNVAFVVGDVITFTARPGTNYNYATTTCGDNLVMEVIRLS